MKSKGVTYALLIAVALIWYNVFFRVKSNLFGEDVPVIQPDEVTSSIASLTRDTFSLKANYRDPFSGSLKPVVSPQPSSDEVSAERIPKRVYEEPWPQIIYYGQVKKTGSQAPLAILKVDGMQFYLRSGESVFDDYVIRRIYRDSIEVVHGKQRKMVKVKK